MSTSPVVCTRLKQLSSTKLQMPVNSWKDEIRKAELRIEELKLAIGVFREMEESGEPWPGEDRPQELQGYTQDSGPISRETAERFEQCAESVRLYYEALGRDLDRRMGAALGIRRVGDSFVPCQPEQLSSDVISQDKSSAVSASQEPPQ